MPAGRYPVGQSTVHIAAAEPNWSGVRLWYPADPASAPAGWRRRASLAIRRRVLGRGADDATPNRRLAADPARFPVIVYHPGWPGTQVDNYRLIGALAGHGFCVAAILYADRTPMNFTTDAECRRTIELASRRVHARARDTALLLDLLCGGAARADGWCIHERLDPGKVGVMGFSFGGAVAAETANVDARVRAVVNIDGRHWGAALEHGVARPYLFLGAPVPAAAAADLDAALDAHDQARLAMNLRRHGGLRVTIDGASHLNFTDVALRLRLRRRPDTGPIAPRRALDIMNAYVGDFFRLTLCGRASPLLEPGARPFPEAGLEFWPAPDRRRQPRPGRRAAK